MNDSHLVVVLFDLGMARFVTYVQGNVRRPRSTFDISDRVAHERTDADGS